MSQPSSSSPHGLTRSRWQRLSAIFDETIELGPEARAEYLKHACGADAKLRAEAEELLAAIDAPDDFLASFPGASSVPSTGGS